MSNLSLMNPGTSLNFDGQELQNAQEDEYRKEEEHQQNELRQLLTNAFDDLLDEDDILSVTSDEGLDSRNTSISRSRRASQDESQSSERRAIESGQDSEWGRHTFPGPTSTPNIDELSPFESPRYDSSTPLGGTYEFHAPDGRHINQHDNIPQQDRHGHIEQNTQNVQEVYGHGDQWTNPQFLKTGADDFQSTHPSLEHVQPHHNVIPEHVHTHQHAGYVQNLFDRRPQVNPAEREETEGGNVDQHQFEHGSQQHYWMHHGHYGYYNRDTYQEEDQPRGGYLGGYQRDISGQAGHEGNYPSQGYYTASSSGGTTVPVSGNHPIYQFSHVHTNMPHVSHQAPESTDFTTGTSIGQIQHEAGGYLTQSIPVSSAQSPRKSSEVRKSSEIRKSADMLEGISEQYSRVNPQADIASLRRSLEFLRKSSEFTEDYKVHYKKGNVERDVPKEEEEERHQLMEEPPQRLDNQQEREFFLQDGSQESRQNAQLQILYKARGRKLDDMTQDFENLKQETAREIRILKHQLSVAKGEREGMATSLNQCQGLLEETKEENAKLTGKLHATEAQVDVIKQGREELMKKLQTAESTIETLNDQLTELGNSESMSRARHEHEVVVSGLQQKYEREIRVLKEKGDQLNGQLNDKNNEISSLRQQLNSSIKAAEDAHISRAETINRLTRSLEDSQRQCHALLESSSSQEASLMKVQVQQAQAARTMSEEMCQTLQEELKDLKEQLSLLESASSLGVFSQASTRTSYRLDGHDDSMADLGIKKTLDFRTPESTQRIDGACSSDEMVQNLKAELERCLTSNRHKRAQVTSLREELKSVKDEVTGLQSRCNRAEKAEDEYKTKLKEFEDLMGSGDATNAVEARLKKDIDNVRREKAILLEDIEDLKKRLDEVATSEEKLTSINRQLSQQISQMVKEYDEDKRAALQRCQRACEQVHETSRNRLREDLSSEHEAEKSSLTQKYEDECNKLRTELKAALQQVDEVKELYVRVCEEKNGLQENVESTMEEKLKERLNSFKEKLEKEKEVEIQGVQDDMASKEEVMRAKLRDEWKAESDEELKRAVETKVAMIKVDWFEEQRTSKKIAVENAVKLAQNEWKLEMEEIIETAVKQKVEEAKEDWIAERKLSMEAEIHQALQSEKTKWEDNSAQELDQSLQREKEQWSQQVELDIIKRVNQEKQKWQQTMEEEIVDRIWKEKETWKQTMEAGLTVRIESEKEKWRENMNSEIQDRIQCEKNKWEDSLENLLLSRIDIEKEKWEEKLESRIMAQIQIEKETWQGNLDNTIQSRLQVEKLKWQENADSLMLEKVQSEKEKWSNESSEKIKQEKERWRENTELEIQECIQREKSQLKEHLEREFHNRMSEEKTQWHEEIKSKVEKDSEELLQQKLSSELHQQLETEKEKWQSGVTAGKELEMRLALETAQQTWQRSHDAELQQLTASWEERVQERIQKEVMAAVDRARQGWEREHELEASTNLSETSIAIYKEEIESFKLQNDHLQGELSKQREKFEQLKQQDNLERKKALEEVQDQYERDYQKFLADHNETLTQALKAARESHNKEKSELQKRHDEEVCALKQREQQLTQQLQENRKANIDDQEIKGTSFIWDKLGKETEDLKKERERLLQDITEREVLLEKADSHLSQEVDKLRTELQMAYQRRLEAETASWRQKLELEFSRTQTSENKEKSQIQLQLNEANEELQRVKGQLYDETAKYLAEIQVLTDEVAEKSKQLQSLGEVHEELEQTREICEQNQIKAESLHSEKMDLVQRLEELELQCLQLEGEKISLVERMQHLETVYQNDLASHQQKQEEGNSRMQKAEKAFQDMKNKHKVELENLRKSLEAENNDAIEMMKDKIIEQQKHHMAAMENLKKQHVIAKQELLKKLQQEKDRILTSTPVQTEEVEEVAVLELRSQYLTTVNKIKDDVMRHITETNLRAAETVKTEMYKERETTLEDLKTFYKDNIRKLLQNEIMEANVETKLAAIDQALEAISDNSSSVTPRSRSVTPSSMMAANNYRNNQNRRSVSLDKMRRSKNSTMEISLSSRSPVSGHSSRDGDFSPRETTLPKEDISPRDVSANVSHRSAPRLREDNTRQIKTDSISPRSGEWQTKKENYPVQQGQKHVRISENSVNKSPRYEDGRNRRTESREKISPRDRENLEVTTGHVSDVYSKDEEDTRVPDTSLPNSAPGSHLNSRLYKTTSEPALNGEHIDELSSNSTVHRLDTTYRYTSLRDGLYKSAISQPKAASQSQEDLRYVGSRTENEQPASLDANLLNLGLGQSSPRKYNPCPERLQQAHDAGDSPTSTPRLSRKIYPASGGMEPSLKEFDHPSGSGTYLSQEFSPGLSKEPSMSNTQRPRSAFVQGRQPLASLVQNVHEEPVETTSESLYHSARPTMSKYIPVINFPSTSKYQLK